MLKLLCAADLHLGLQPSRIPAELRDDGGLAGLAPRAAWFRLVDLALTQKVHAVVLAGDVVEQSDDFYEAYADLSEGVERLVGAGIRVVAVAGNHDVEVLPRLAKAVDGFELLGEGGEWELLRIEAEGESVDLLGWSFTTGQARIDPLTLAVPERTANPLIGILHCDRDASNSRYAPVRSSELEAADVDAWLLGHVHKPDRLDPSRPIGYLGSLSATDPGEPGEHGAWLLQVEPTGIRSLEMMPLAPLRWDELEVDVTGLESPDDVHGALLTGIRSLHERIGQEILAPAAVGLRVVFTGRNSHGDALRRSLLATDPRNRAQPFGDIDYFVHNWRIDALPAVDLTELARNRNDLAGLLAAKLLALRKPDSDERASLLRDARRRMPPLHEHKYFQALALEPASDEELASLLESAAVTALDRLLAQREQAT